MKDQILKRRVEVQIDLPESVYSRLKLQSEQTGLSIDTLIYTVLYQDVFGSSGRSQRNLP